MQKRSLPFLRTISVAADQLLEEGTIHPFSMQVFLDVRADDVAFAVWDVVWPTKHWLGVSRGDFEWWKITQSVAAGRLKYRVVTVDDVTKCRPLGVG